MSVLGIDSRDDAIEEAILQVAGAVEILARSMVGIVALEDLALVIEKAQIATTIIVEGYGNP